MLKTISALATAGGMTNSAVHRLQQREPEIASEPVTDIAMPMPGGGSSSSVGIERDAIEVDIA